MIKAMSTRITLTLAVIGTLLSSAVFANTLQTVNVSQGKDDARIVKITFKDDLSKLPVHFTTANPNRIVLDFAGTESGVGRVNENVATGVVDSYSLVPVGDRTRMVIGLNSPVTYDVRKDKNVLILAVRGQVGAAQDVLPAALAKPAVKEYAHKINNVTFRRGGEGESRVEVALSQPGIAVDVKRKIEGIQLDFINTALPKDLQRRLDVSDFATPVQTIETVQQDKLTRMLVSPKGKWDYFAYQTGTDFVIEVKPIEDEFGSKKTGKPKYTGEKLSLDFHNEDVSALLKVIADYTGLNIVTSESVKGTIPALRLVDVPWDQALDIILRAKGLDKRVDGNVIWVAPQDELTAKEKQQLEAKQQSSALEDLVSHNYKLNYLRADEALTIVTGGSRGVTTLGKAVSCSLAAEGVSAPTSTGSGQSGSTSQNNQANSSSVASNSLLSPRGAATYDLTTNTLIVNDIATRHAEIDRTLKELDIPARQVMIEARVVVADDGFSRNLGARLGFKAEGAIAGTRIGLSPTANDALAATAGLAGTTTTPFNVDLPAQQLGTPATLGIGIINAASTAVLGLEIQAMESDNRGQIVSNPRVITSNLKPAVILQGQQIPYTVVEDNAANTQFVDALLCLLVSPQVLNNDDVIMEVEVQKDAPREATAGGAPPIDRRRVKTQVRVKNGETAVLGGIFEQNKRSDTSKVPLLGDIPVLGNLFKTNYKQDTKTELMIFLTPRILESTSVR